jgi:membrane associated rhomboid family serine protease
MAFIITIILLQPNKKLYAILFIAVVFYGSSWWGLLPLLPQVSHEGHISGTIAGILIAIIGKKYWVAFLPKAVVPEWYKKEWNHENPYDKIE